MTGVEPRIQITSKFHYLLLKLIILNKWIKHFPQLTQFFSSNFSIQYTELPLEYFVWIWWKRMSSQSKYYSTNVQREDIIISKKDYHQKLIFLSSLASNSWVFALTKTHIVWVRNKKNINERGLYEVIKDSFNISNGKTL